MELDRKIIKKLGRFFSKTRKIADKRLEEEKYYEWFFTKNEDWNKPFPNIDEKIRWEGIKVYVELVTERAMDKIEILDVGCGRGWLTNLLSSYGDVIGTEPVAPVVEYARKLFPNLDFRNGTLKDFIENKCLNKFDLVVSSEVIEHVSDSEKDEFVSSIAKLIKKNGYLIVSTPRQEALKDYSLYMKPSQPIEDWMTENEVEVLFTRNGFEVENRTRLSKMVGNSTGVIEVYQLWLFKKI